MHQKPFCCQKNENASVDNVTIWRHGKQTRFPTSKQKLNSLLIGLCSLPRRSRLINPTLKFGVCYRGVGIWTGQPGCAHVEGRVMYDIRGWLRPQWYQPHCCTCLLVSLPPSARLGSACCCFPLPLPGPRSPLNSALLDFVYFCDLLGRLKTSAEEWI